MGKDTAIAWTHHTFNPVWGCTKASAGCANCYAEAFARRWGFDVFGPGKPRRTFGEKHWGEPRRWNARAAQAGIRERVFCGSMCDVFESAPELDAGRTKLFALIAETPALDWLLLTKRPGNVLGMAPRAWRHRWPTNVWLGVTVENQPAADERIPLLLQVPAAVRFLSCEPLLEPVDLRQHLLLDDPTDPLGLDAVRGIDWVIVGGESGSGARPFDLAWARSIIAQCRADRTACFVKQLGHNRECDWEGPFFGATYPDAQCSGGVLLDLDSAGPGEPLAVSDVPCPACKGSGYRRYADAGADPAEWPEDLRVREFPEARR